MSNSENPFIPPGLNSRSLPTRYQVVLQEPGLIRDEAQIRTIGHLGRLWTELMMFKYKRNHFLGRNLHSPQVPKSLYFYDGVGWGRSFLMDASYGRLSYRRKHRVHFHAFMAGMHQRSKGLKNEANSFGAATAEITEGTRVLYFNEFHISNVTDTMTLGRLLESLLNEEVVLAAAFNYAPSELCPQGQNRGSFLPTVALIEANLTVLNVDGGGDYRLRTLKPAEIFLILGNDEDE